MKLEKLLRTETDGGDQLSVLHDSILCHILSFLPTKFAAATSVLSKRWRYLFALVPDIDLNDSVESNYETKHACFQPVMMKQGFKDVVDRVLAVRNSFPIRKFQLKCRTIADNSVTNSWISAALLHNLQVLILRFGEDKFDNYIGALPSETFTSKTLVVLKLFKVAVENPKLVSMPNLKVLHLRSARLVGDNPEWKFSKGYPVLEDLLLFECELCYDGVLDISVPSLKTLSFAHISWAKTIFIDAPNLKYLLYRADLREVFVNNLKSLVAAEVFVFPSCLSSGSEVSHAKCLSSMINELYNAKFISLSPGTLDVLLSYGHPLPKFMNLTRIMFGAGLDNQRGELSKFWDDSRADKPILLSHKSTCDGSNGDLVKDGAKVDARKFYEEVGDFYPVSNLLKHGQILERVSIGGLNMTNEKWPSFISDRLRDACSRYSMMKNIVFIKEEVE